MPALILKRFVRRKFGSLNVTRAHALHSGVVHSPQRTNRPQSASVPLISTRAGHYQFRSGANRLNVDSHKVQRGGLSPTLVTIPRGIEHRQEVFGVPNPISELRYRCSSRHPLPLYIAIDSRYLPGTGFKHHNDGPRLGE
jgi:hypothetical protein